MDRTITTIRLWDARTFHQLHVLKHADGIDIGLIVFSPDGRWLVCGHSPRSDYYIWNIASGTLHKSFHSQPDERRFPSTTAVFDPASSTHLAIVQERSVVKILDAETGGELAVFGSGTINRVAFSPDGMLVVTASVKGVMKLWDAYAGVELFSLEGHEHQVFTARFSPCGTYVASASQDRTVRLWRTRNGSCVVTFSEHKDSLGVFHVAFSADGKTLWSRDEDGTVIMQRMCDIIPTDEQDP